MEKLKKGKVYAGSDFQRCWSIVIEKVREDRAVHIMKVKTQRRGNMRGVSFLYCLSYVAAQILGDESSIVSLIPKHTYVNAMRNHKSQE